MRWGKKKEEPEEIPKVYEKQVEPPRVEVKELPKKEVEPIYRVVQELPKVPIREYKDEKTGGTVYLITVEEALSEMMNSD